MCWRMLFFKWFWTSYSHFTCQKWKNSLEFFFRLSKLIAHYKLSTTAWAIRLDLMVHVSLALKRSIYRFKNSFSSYFVSILEQNMFFQEGILPQVLEINLAQGDRNRAIVSYWYSQLRRNPFFTHSTINLKQTEKLQKLEVCLY